MRRFKMILILSLFMIFSTITAYADNSNIIQVNMSGNILDVRQVPILLDGQVLESKIPSFIFIDRTLVPVRFVLENYGAEVTWDQPTKTATVIYEDKIIKLTIDSPVAYINDQTKVLDKNSIPRLVTFFGEDARTMVPLAFISELLGYEVGYDEVNRVPYINTQAQEEQVEEDPIDKDIEEGTDKDVDSPATITDIYIDKGSTNKHKVIIKSDGKIQYATEVLTRTDKLVIDIHDAKLNIKNQNDRAGSLSLKDDNFTKVEYSQHSYGPDVVRIEIAMTDRLDFDIVSSKDGKTNVVSFVNKINVNIIILKKWVFQSSPSCKKPREQKRATPGSLLFLIGLQNIRDC